MDFSQTLRARHSTRWFTDTPVPERTLQDIVRDALQTASWADSQPWKVYMATGETMRKIRTLHLDKREEGDEPASLLPMQHRGDMPAEKSENMHGWSTHYEETVPTPASELGMLNRRLFNAPAAAYLAIPSNAQPWAVFDLGGFATTLTLAAADRGIGSIIAYEFAKYPQDLARILGVEDGYAIAIGIGLGHEDQTRPTNSYRAPREPLERILKIRD